MTGPRRRSPGGSLITARTRKVMLYSHDTYGLGHLRRNLRIAGHLLAAAPQLQIVLVSGSPVAGWFPTAPGLTVVKLPSVRKVAAEDYRPVDGRLPIGLVRRTRTAIMVDVVRRFRPDVLLVDHSPAGMGGELLGVFAAVAEASPATRVVLGLRDILDHPDTVVRTWTEQGIYPLLTETYDDIVVYGSRAVFDVGRHYRMPQALADRLHYAGYLAPDGTGRGDGTGHDAGTGLPDGTGRGDGTGTSPSEAAASGSGSPYLLATAGGGGDGLAVLAAAMEAGASLGMATKVVAGPLIEEDDLGALQLRAARTPGVELVRFHPQLQSAMAGASALVTMGGYNSLCEALSVGVPTVVVPRSQPRLEQAIRAGIFAERGLVSTVPAGPDLPARLARSVADAMSGRPASDPIDLGGLDRLTQLLLAGPARQADARDGTGHRAAGRRAERLPA